MRHLALLLSAAAAASPALAGAVGPGPSITLNGVPIDGATNQRFENATVVIDARGNVAIEARGYAARGAPAPAPAQPPSQPQAGAAAPQPPALAHRYFLATEGTAPAGVEDEVAVFVNAAWIRALRSSDPPVVMEITRYLAPGPNRILLAATRRVGADQRPGTTGSFQVVAGEGRVDGDRVTIAAPPVRLARAPGERGDRSEEYVLEAR